ncbi:Protein of unknown function [Leuconostoc citreum LBAE E16]|nr:Protein of unknown function [Leuconostoc citreum LBAE C11]CCF29316.1 Protein of unknown function [Leuconostoc citreum LBAE E16]
MALPTIGTYWNFNWLFFITQQLSRIVYLW